MKKKHDLVEIEGFLIHETEPECENRGAFLVKTADKEVWLPKNAVEAHNHPSGKYKWYIFDVPQNLAEDKGLV